MSGPKTVEYELQRRAEEEARLREEAQRRERERRTREGERDRLAKAQASVDAAERRAARLERLARESGVDATLQRPHAPGRSDAGSLERFARLMERETAQLEARLQQTFSEQAQQLRLQALQKLAHTATAAELLDAFSRQSLAHAPAGGDMAEQRRERALKVIGRLAGLAADALPADLEALMAEMVGAPNALRAEALELELRLRVQRFNAAQAQRAKEKAEADAILASLPFGAACDAVRQSLELVSAGMAALDDTLRVRVRDAVEADEAALRAERCEQASQVLADTLKDLGYEADGIENTLFVEGGVAHINKAEWGDYYVRLRVNPGEQTVNLNMVREREQSGEQGSAQRSADAAAEASWCSGLPQLMKTLEARGLPMKLKRQLSAGAVPVQEVEPGAIPPSLKRTSGRRSAEPKAQTMKPRS